MDTNFQPVTQRGARGKYRQHSLEFKRTLVEMAHQLGVSVARLAPKHGVNANQVFSWRKLYEAGQLVANASAQGSELVPGTVASSVQTPEMNTATGAV
jgi:transposase